MKRKPRETLIRDAERYALLTFKQQQQQEQDISTRKLTDEDSSVFCPPLSETLELFVPDKFPPLPEIAQHIGFFCRGEDAFMLLEEADTDLFEWLVSSASIRVQYVAEHMGQLLLGLDRFHRRDMCWLDLKPENVLVFGAKTESPRVKITDICCLKGTAAYMQPDYRRRLEMRDVTSGGSVPSTPGQWQLLKQQRISFHLQVQQDLWSLARLILNYAAMEHLNNDIVSFNDAECDHLLNVHVVRAVMFELEADEKEEAEEEEEEKEAAKSGVGSLISPKTLRRLSLGTEHPTGRSSTRENLEDNPHVAAIRGMFAGSENVLPIMRTAITRSVTMFRRDPNLRRAWMGCIRPSGSSTQFGKNSALDAYKVLTQEISRVPSGHIERVASGGSTSNSNNNGNNNNNNGNKNDLSLDATLNSTTICDISRERIDEEDSDGPEQKQQQSRASTLSPGPSSARHHTMSLDCNDQNIESGNRNSIGSRVEDNDAESWKAEAKEKAQLWAASEAARLREEAERKALEYRNKLTTKTFNGGGSASASAINVDPPVIAPTISAGVGEPPKQSSNVENSSSIVSRSAAINEPKTSTEVLFTPPAPAPPPSAAKLTSGLQSLLKMSASAFADDSDDDGDARYLMQQQQQLLRSRTAALAPSTKENNVNVRLFEEGSGLSPSVSTNLPPSPSPSSSSSLHNNPATAPNYSNGTTAKTITSEEGTSPNIPVLPSSVSSPVSPIIPNSNVNLVSRSSLHQETDSIIRAAAAVSEKKTDSSLVRSSSATTTSSVTASSILRTSSMPVTSTSRTPSSSVAIDTTHHPLGQRRPSSDSLPPRSPFSPSIQQSQSHSQQQQQQSRPQSIFNPSILGKLTPTDSLKSNSSSSRSPSSSPQLKHQMSSPSLTPLSVTSASSPRRESPFYSLSSPLAASRTMSNGLQTTPSLPSPSSKTTNSTLLQQQQQQRQYAYRSSLSTSSSPPLLSNRASDFSPKAAPTASTPGTISAAAAAAAATSPSPRTSGGGLSPPSSSGLSKENARPHFTASSPPPIAMQAENVISPEASSVSSSSGSVSALLSPEFSTRLNSGSTRSPAPVSTNPSHLSVVTNIPAASSLQTPVGLSPSPFSPGMDSSEQVISLSIQIEKSPIKGYGFTPCRFSLREHVDHQGRKRTASVARFLQLLQWAELGGLPVIEVNDFGPARAAGLKTFDVIISINDINVCDMPANSAVNLLASSSTAVLIIQRRVMGRRRVSPPSIFSPPIPPNSFTTVQPATKPQPSSSSSVSSVPSFSLTTAAAPSSSSLYSSPAGVQHQSDNSHSEDSTQTFTAEQRARAAMFSGSPQLRSSPTSGHRSRSGSIEGGAASSSSSAPHSWWYEF